MKEFWKPGFILALVLLAVAGLVVNVGCGDDDDDDDDEGATGSLDFLTNGEAFIRDGFVGKTGWDISFDHFWVTLSGVTAYQEPVDSEGGLVPLHAGHDHDDIPEGAAHVFLEGEHPVDLTVGADAVLLGTASDAPVGNYNHVNFNMIEAATGDYAGYSIVMIGSAVKDEETVDFTIRLDEQMTFYGCHQEVDDEFAGVVEEDGTGSVEMTFHSDHLFGDWETLNDPEGVNPDALGFQPFADLAQGGVLDIDQDEMMELMSTADYVTFLDALKTLGHSGEGHCEYREYSE